MDKKRLLTYGGYLLLLLVLVAILGYNCPHRPGAVITGDPVHGYAPLIDSGEVTDWHCALFLHECILLRDAIHTISGCMFSGLDILKLLWYPATLLIIGNFLYWARKSTSAGKAYIAVPYLVSLMLLLHFKGFIMFLCLDYFFIALLLTSISLILALHSNNRKWILIILLVFVLLHLGQYRRNAAVLLPVLCMLASVAMLPQKGKVKLLLCSLAASVLIYFGGHWLTRTIFTTRSTQPTVMMLTSDLLVAASLRGESEEEKAEIYRTSGIEVQHKDPLFTAGVPVEWNLTYTEQQWSNFMQHYRHSWEQHTGSMLMARALQLTQFFSYGHTSPAMVETATVLYPAAMGKIKNTTNQLRSIERFTCSVREIFYTIAIALLVYAPFRKRKSSTSTAIMLLTLMAMLYLSSYILITPTGDDRYHAPAIILLCWAFSLAIAHLFSKSQSQQKSPDYTCPQR